MAIWVCAIKRKTRETLMGGLGSQHVHVIVHMRRCIYYWLIGEVRLFKSSTEWKCHIETTAR